MKTICITGGNGLLGSKLLEAAGKDYRTISIDLQTYPIVLHENMKYIQGNITDSQEIKEYISSEKPICVFHTAAFTGVDNCEKNPEKAWQVNVHGTENVAAACRKLGIKMIHISTDYVFDGNHGPYDEEQKTNPLSMYGKTKLESEKFIINNVKDFCIARTMVLYGYQKGIRQNFVTWLIDSLRHGKSISIVDDQYGTPTLADDLAKVLLVLMKENRRGLYNAAGGEWINRYDFALRIAEIFNLRKSLIKRISSHNLNQPAPRPLNSGLRTDKICKEVGVSFSSVSQGLKIMKSQMDISSRE